ncbi:MAG: outer membrane protein assembly factor BamB [Planctomycetota bacterium]|jgi:outer membrane protein assembly factor BamB
MQICFSGYRQRIVFAATLLGMTLVNVWSASLAARAADWPSFRGPTLSGLAAEAKAPTRWADDQNIRWKVELPRPGNGSPIVVGDQVYVTSAEDAEGKGRSLYCFDAASGAKKWVRTVTAARKFATHDTNPYCGTTPVATADRVVVWHASAGLHCYDRDGKVLWSRDLGEFEHMWGYGTSPILHAGRVILHSGPGKRVFVGAYELETGKTIWETDEPLEGDADRNKAGKYHGSWTTPVIVRVGGDEQLVLAMPTRVVAYRPADGKTLWWCEGTSHSRGDLAYSSPLIAGDVLFVTGGFNGAAFAVRLGGSGNVTETHRLWRKENNPQSIGSGVVVGEYVYRPNAGPGTIECLEPATGKVRWTQRAGVAYWASLVQVGDLLYGIDQDAATVVFRANPDKFEQVAVNKLTGNCNATPAVSGARLFVRTEKSLVCIGE